MIWCENSDFSHNMYLNAFTVAAGVENSSFDHNIH